MSILPEMYFLPTASRPPVPHDIGCKNTSGRKRLPWLPHPGQYNGCREALEHRNPHLRDSPDNHCRKSTYRIPPQDEGSAVAGAQKSWRSAILPAPSPLFPEHLMVQLCQYLPAEIYIFLLLKRLLSRQKLIPAGKGRKVSFSYHYLR